MNYRKNMKIGVSIIFLLLIFTSCLSLNNLTKSNNLLENNTPSLSAATEDWMEDNDNYWDASWVTPSYYPNLTIIESDEDWFQLYLNPGDFIDVYIYFNNSEGDLDLELYDPFDSMISRDGSYSTNDMESLSFAVDTSGDWRIRVYHYYGNTNVSYDLDIWVSTGDDWMEENDDFWGAWGVGDGYYSGLKILGFDEDWYQIYLNPGDTIDVSIYFAHADGDLQLELYNPSYIQRTESYSDNDNEYLSFTALVSGDWRIRVYHLYGNSDVEYDLDILIYSGATGDDWMEDNDDFWGAWWVDPNYYSGLKIQGFDEDWFQLYLNSGDSIDISIYFNHFDGDLQLVLYDPSYIQRKESYSTNDNEYISFNADLSGNWRIRVFHEYGDSDVEYDLDIWLHVKEEDAYEENDYEWDAYNLIPYEGWWLTDINGPGFQSDDDWYEIYAEPGFELLIINSPHFGGDIQLEIYDASFNLIGGKYSYEYDEPIRFKLHSSGTYFIKVFGSNNGFFYDFQYLTVCLLEEQTWLRDIYGLGVQGNLDFFYIDVTPGFKHLRVDLLFNHIEGNIDMELFDEWGTKITNSSSFDDNEYIDTLLDPGIYFLLIHGDNMWNEYNLWWDDEKTDLRSDDNYEMNNEPLFAYDLSNYEHMSLWDINGMGLQFDEDWYEIYMSETRLRLIVIAKYDSAEGLMGFEIYNDNLIKITGNFTSEDNDYIDYEVPSNGTYYIRIFGDSSGNVYNLWWAAEEVDEIGMIPGYDLLILLGSLIGITVVMIKVKRSKIKH